MKRIGKYKIDFVIPLHTHNILFPLVIETVIEFYSPRTIYIITSTTEIEKLKEQVPQWNTKQTKISYVEEETFFQYRYHKNLEKIKKWYTYKDEKSREFGWWYQQIMKIGAVYRIPKLSTPFIIWDADLIPLQKWTLYPSFKIPHFHFALLQDREKNDFNRKQYSCSLYELLKLPEIRPIRSKIEGGSFISHHFVFYPHIIRCFIRYIEKIHHCTSQKPWFRVILQLSKKYYRFSEYKNIATFMSYFFPKKIHYHSFLYYGKNGERILEPEESLSFIRDLKKNISPHKNHISLRSFNHYLYFKYEQPPTYIQVENSSC
jgi:hypothetical protein